MNFVLWSLNKKIHKKLQLSLANFQGIDSNKDVIFFDENYF